MGERVLTDQQDIADKYFSSVVGVLGEGDGCVDASGQLSQSLCVTGLRRGLC